jgi:hypothetical protein
MTKFFTSLGIQVASLLMFGLIVSLFAPPDAEGRILSGLMVAGTWGLMGSPVLLISSILHSLRK